MKPCLADVNVVLPLLVRHHEHHQPAMLWFDSLAAGEGVLCRFVQLAVMRLLGNRTIMGKYAVSALMAWNLIQELLGDERLDFIPEPPLIDEVLPELLRYPVATNQLLGDAYLAAFSITGQVRLVTFDSGFRQFRGVDLHLLKA